MAGYGQAFEGLIKRVNTQYRHRGIADIEKQEVATVINPGKYAYRKEKSIVDFIGFYKRNIFGVEYIPVAFDTKETRDENKFPLSDIRDHQYEFLKMRHEKFPGTENFILIECIKIRKIFRIDFPELKRRWEAWKSGKGVPDDNKNGSYASISFEWMEQNLEPIESKSGIIVDYLRIGDAEWQDILNQKNA